MVRQKLLAAPLSDCCFLSGMNNNPLKSSPLLAKRFFLRRRDINILQNSVRSVNRMRNFLKTHFHRIATIFFGSYIHSSTQSRTDQNPYQVEHTEPQQ